MNLRLKFNITFFLMIIQNLVSKQTENVLEPLMKIA